jgi:threonine dehydrogenase-like Zn-dependent dehydrogenase
MRAARIVAPRRIAVEDVPVPTPGPEQVRFKVSGTGVCASNLGPWLGLPWLRYPFDPGESGHEAWGVVDSVGDQVQGVSPGDVIAAVSYHAYAEYDVADASAVVRLSGKLADRPFPGEALGTAMNIMERSAVREGQVVAVVGIGFIGALLTRLAAERGARVIAISRRDSSLALAKAMGSQETVKMDDHAAIIERVRDLTGGELCDTVIEAVGQQWPLDLSAELTKTRGRLVIAGYHQDGPRQVNLQLWNWRGLDVVNAHEREKAVYAAGIRAAADAVISGRLDPSPLYTHHFPLEELATALDHVAERPDGFVKALVLP